MNEFTQANASATLLFWLIGAGAAACVIFWSTLRFWLRHRELQREREDANAIAAAQATLARRRKETA